MNDVSQAGRTAKRFALFEYGFRPFFLLSGLYAIAAIALWLWMYRNGRSPLTPLPPQLWHGHEMLFGFVGATIAGFMLTAVPSWTGSRGFGGPPLIALTLLWLAGRLALGFAASLPTELVVACELAFLPALMLTLAPSLLRTPNRNTPLLLVLAAFWILDVLFLWGAFHDDASFARRSLLSALDIVLLLITIIGGRIVPAFTSNALKLRGIEARLHVWRGLERLVIGSMTALVLIGFIAPGHELVAPMAALASLAHLARLAGWQTWRTLPNPIVWVLHAAYLWLPVGLGLKALYLFGGFPFAAHWLHALAAGAAATMILAVMTRAALGHTGRPLRVARPIPWAYALLILAGLTRVFGHAVLPVGYVTIVTLATAFWIAAFLLFAIVYAPILMRPRVDGKSG